MGCPAVSRAAAIYRPRRPRASPLHRLLDGYFRKFEQVYDERYQNRYGFWRPVISGTVEKLLACGDLREGVARVRCPRCRYELFVALLSTDRPKSKLLSVVGRSSSDHGQGFASLKCWLALGCTSGPPPSVGC